MPVVEARKVAVLGAAGGIGQPLSLLLKMNKLVTELSLYDIANVKGVAADLSHCNTPVQVGTLGPASRRRKAGFATAAGQTALIGDDGDA
jgi:malate/lactate dehydrogenase